MNKDELIQTYPEITLLSYDDRDALSIYLRNRGILEANDSVVKTEKAGEGNMNFTMRVHTNQRTIILKQSRPWVEKYPDIKAPWDRVMREARFYELIKDHPQVASLTPEFYDLDPISRIIAIEDLGEARDFTDLYQGMQLTPDNIKALSHWLGALHSISFDETSRNSLTNRDMRELNHEHIFHYPLIRNNGLDLNGITDGLSEAANRLINDVEYVEAVEELGQFYLEDGPTLLHGDFFPGSWLKTRGGIMIIDPEFSFFGGSEYEIGVMLAHFILAQQNYELITQFVHRYRFSVDISLVKTLKITGAEIMRRLIGVAQLPLSYGLKKKVSLLETSHTLVLHPEKSVLYASVN